MISAGAGSGKTYQLCETIAEKVSNKTLDPARILATTFTRKAAAEIKGRIQSRLLKNDAVPPLERLEMAQRLELAAIGTVHSVGHQLLSRYAIQFGLSPNLKVLEAENTSRYLSEIIGKMPRGPWNELEEIARRFAMKGQTSVLKTLDVKRSNLIEDAAFEKQMLDGLDRLLQLVSPSGPDKSTKAFATLHDLAKKALNDLPQPGDTTKKTKKVLYKLRGIAFGQQRWSDYPAAAKLEAQLRNSDPFLNDLRAEAATVRRQQMLLEDISRYVELCIQLTVELGKEFRQFKDERGLVDFTDLEVLLYRLLCEKDLKDSLKQEFDLIVIDEFQDTSPLQLVIFQQLLTLVPESHWVGDPKQAIYGFRGTEPRLVEEVWKSSTVSSSSKLPVNYRSQKGLVQLIGKLFKPVLKKEAVQKPSRPAEERGVERWLFDSWNIDNDKQALSVGVRKLQDEEIPLKNIAILCRTNREVQSVGEFLQDIAIPAILNLPGLFSTREGSLVLSGLRLVADRSDSLAAATIKHILDDPSLHTPTWINERLKAVKSPPTSGGKRKFQFPWHDDALFNPLETIDHRVLHPSVTVQRVIDALHVGDFAREWGDAPRRSAHLESILQQARTYEEEALEMGQASTLAGLITCFEDLAADGEDTRLAPSGLDAVTVMTFHRAKGLEWPVVVLAGLDFSRDPDLWSPRATGGWAVPDKPLEGREMHYWPWPFGSQSYYNSRLAKGTGLEEDAIDSTEGQNAATKEQAEAIRLLYVGCTRARDKLVIAHRKNQYDWLESLSGLDQILDPNLDEGEHALKDIDTTYVVRHLSPKEYEGYIQDALPEETWLDNLKGKPAEYSRRYHSPSGAEKVKAKVSLEDLETGAIYPALADDDFERLGNAIHAWLGALPSVRSLADGEKSVVAERCLTSFGMSGVLQPADLVAMGKELERWITEKYPQANWSTEVAVSSKRTGGGQWVGFADLLLILPDDKVVIIDHKSAPITPAQCERKAESYAGQLSAYMEILETQGLTVVDSWIHFPVAGVMAKVEHYGAV